MNAATIDLENLAAGRRRLQKPVGRIRPPDLDDPGQFTRVGRMPLGQDPGASFQPVAKVPLLDTCDVPGKYKADAQDLARIVANTNRRVDRGEYPLLTIGHFREQAPETEQPPLVGYLKNFVLGQFQGSPCVLADAYISVEHYDEAMTYPRRSVELWTGTGDDDNYIDSVALLRRSPERDLGLVTFAKTASGDRMLAQFSRDPLPTARELGRRLAEAARPYLGPRPPSPQERAAIREFAARRGIADVAEARRQYFAIFGREGDRRRATFAKSEEPSYAEQRQAVVDFAVKHGITNLRTAREEFLTHVQAGR